MNPVIQAEFASKGLDTALDPPARCATSLFQLLTRVAVDARLIASGEQARATTTDSLRLWSNRPGQNTTETYTLALLSLGLIGGLSAAWIIDSGNGRWWAWLIALPVAPLAAFIALHLIAFGAALCGSGLQKLGVAAHQPHSRVTLFLSLLILTAIAASAALSACPLRLAAAAPWLAWAALNFFAWAALLAIDLVATLREQADE